MTRRIIVGLATLCLALMWAALVGFITLNGWFRPALTDDRSATAFLAAAEASVPADFRGNMFAVLLERGQPVGQFAIGPEGTVPDDASVFQIGSLSKWVTAAGVLALVDEGLIGLDDSVESHLTRWRFPESAFDSREVTVRRLLSHTAGLTDGLGYNGFANPADLQTLKASLSQAADAMPGALGRVEIGRTPGRVWSYSGGGYTVLQMMIEDVTGQSFAEAMAARVFRPIGMDNSSFRVADIEDDLVPFFDGTGAPAALFHYTALAAASLYTSGADMAAFLTGLSRPSTEGGLLTAEMLKAMRHAEAQRFGLPIWGLGVTLYVQGEVATVIGHDGRNQPAINTTARLHVSSGDGIVLLATGTTDLASRLGDDWIYWRTGRVAVTALTERPLVVLAWLILGFGVIGAVAIWRMGSETR